MDDVQRLVIAALQLQHERLVGPYMLVSKAWTDAVREICKNSLLREYWAECAKTEDVVYVDMFTTCRCTSCAQHLNCESQEIKLELITMWEPEVVRGWLCGLEVELTGTERSGSIWLKDVVTSVQRVASSLQQLLKLAVSQKLALYVEAASQEALSDLRPYGAQEADNPWHPVCLYDPDPRYPYG